MFEFGALFSRSAKYEPGIGDTDEAAFKPDNENITAELIGLRFYGSAPGPHVVWLAFEFCLNLLHVGLVQGVKLSTPFMLGSGNLGNHGANLIWNRFFNNTTDVLELHQGPDEVDVYIFKEFLSSLFVRMIRNTHEDFVNHLSPSCLSHLADRIQELGGARTQNSNRTIRRQNFLHEKMVERQGSAPRKYIGFYEWLREWTSHIRNNLILDWNEGIINFCSKKDAELMLGNRPRHLMVRISDYFFDVLVVSWCNDNGVVEHKRKYVKQVVMAQLVNAILDYKHCCEWLVSRHWHDAKPISALQLRPINFDSPSPPSNLPDDYWW